MTRNLQVKILARFMSKKDIESLGEQYEEAKYRRRTVKKPSQNDLRISSYFADVKSVREVTEKFGVSAGRVHGALARVMAHKN